MGSGNDRIMVMESVIVIVWREECGGGDGTKERIVVIQM